MKECTKCKENKKEDQFRKKASMCKACDRLYQQQPKAKLIIMYNNMKANSKSRQRDAPNFTQEEFIEWAGKNGYTPLYDKWVKSKHSKLMSPSVDRKDITKPYTFKNIELVTWEENSRRYVDSTKHKVSQHDMETGRVIKTHDSIREAMRYIKKSGSGKGISRCIRDKQRSAYGHVWKSASKQS